MKTKKLLFSALALSMCLTVSARETGSDTHSFIRDCDVRITVGGSPTAAANYFSDGSIFRGHFDYYPVEEALGELYKDYSGPVMTSGNISASFNYRFCNLLSTGVNLGFTGMWMDNYNGVTDEITSRENGLALYLLPYLRVNYLNRKAIRLYMTTSLGAGKYFGFDELKGWRRDYEGKRYFEDNSLKFEAQLTLFGVEIGKGHWFGCFEMGIGTLYNGASIGAGYRF